MAVAITLEDAVAKIRSLKEELAYTKDVQQKAINSLREKITFLEKQRVSEQKQLLQVAREREALLIADGDPQTLREAAKNDAESAIQSERDSERRLFKERLRKQEEVVSILEEQCNDMAEARSLEIAEMQLNRRKMDFLVEENQMLKETLASINTIETRRHEDLLEVTNAEHHFRAQQKTIQHLKRQKRGILIESELWLKMLCAVRTAYGNAAVDVYINKELRNMNTPKQIDHIRTADLLGKLPEFDLLRAQASLTDVVEESELSEDEEVIQQHVESAKSPAPVLSQGRVLFARAMCLQQEALDLRKSRSVESRRWSNSPELKPTSTPNCIVASPVAVPPPTTPARVSKTRSPWVEGWADYWSTWKSKNITPISRRRSVSAPHGYRR
eukprot:TRINITY_DN14345_c1_g1_i2.p1 TRINITY_DN14345_c1_g1~~TRINITY_DN14345_c1_g1_i2.p1  ORF type:complete len:387 (+),score=71.33 TRINITY_DN14345_c1_g1_i2:120-1280(+)